MKKLLFILIAITSFLGCDSDNQENQKTEDLRSKITIQFDKDTFRSEFERWKSFNIDSYAYTLVGSNLADGAFTYEIIVEKNKVANGDYNTVDELFKMVEDDYNYTIQNYLTNDFYLPVSKINFIIEFDSEFHYPKKITKSIDFHTTPPPGTGGYEYEITQFKRN